MKKFNNYEWSLIVAECLLWLGIVLSLILISAPFWI